MRGISSGCKVAGLLLRGRAFVWTTVFIFIASAAAHGADTDKEFPSVIKASVAALWDGSDFSPELQQKQRQLKKSLDKGTLSRDDLAGMTSEAVLEVINGKKTSRYDLRKLPGRVQDLFAAHLAWEDFRRILWQSAAAGVDQDRQVVITVGTLAPAGTPWINVPEELSGVIEELSDKKITVKIYSGGVMGEDTDILRKMDVGQLDGCGATALGILNASPEASVFLLPGLFQDYDEVDYIFEKFRKRIDRAFEKRGYILASLIDTGQFYIFSKKRISSLDDIKKSKMLTWFGTVETTFFEELGISAMPVSVTEVVSALSTGMAEANVAPASWMLGMQAYQYARYFVDEPLLYSPAAVFVSTGTRVRLQKQFNMSDVFSHNVQELLVFEFNAVEEEWKSQLRKYEARCLDAFISRVGMKAVTLAPQDKKAIEEAGRNVWARLSGQVFPEDFLEDILKALEEFRNSSD